MDLKNSLTIYCLASRIFLNNFYKNNIPFINNTSMYNDINKAYYRGIIEVYIPFGKNFYYKYVKSLYP